MLEESPDRSSFDLSGRSGGGAAVRVESPSDELSEWTLCRGEVVAFATPMTAEPAKKWEPPTAESVARLLPGFDEISFIGRGGMGAVYKAKRLASGNWVALKLLPAHVSADESLRRRFLREAQTLARLDHPRITSVVEAGGEKGEQLYFAMEFVEGRSLHALIRQGKVPPATAWAIVCEVCEALAYAHGSGVVHRDIKPANVLIGLDGHVKLADFGLARWLDPDAESLTQSQMPFGTRDYMAPEQFKKNSSDRRVDLYALGVVYYEMLCKEIPRGQFPAPSVRSGCDTHTDRVIHKAMQSDPELRYQTAEEMLADLRQARPLPAAPDRPPRVFPALTGAAVVAVLLTMLVLAVRHGGAPRLVAEPTATPVVSRPSVVPNEPPVVAAPIASSGWHDWLAEHPVDPALLLKTAAGYVPQIPNGESGLVLSIGPSLDDQALRVTYRMVNGHSRQGIKMFLRATSDFGEYYGLSAIARSWQIIRHQRDRDSVSLATIPRGADAGDETQTIEFRAEGRTLTFWVNGELRALKQSDVFARGQSGLYCTSGVVLLKVEWQELSR